MDFQKKIQEICEQPEQSRRKYVMGGVLACMGFVLIIWIFSVSRDLSSLTEISSESSSSSMNDLRENMIEGGQKIWDAGGKIRSAATDIQKEINGESVNNDYGTSQNESMQQPDTNTTKDSGQGDSDTYDSPILPVPEGELPSISQ